MADNTALMATISALAQKLMGNYNQAPDTQGYQEAMMAAQMDAIAKAKKQAMSDKMAELGIRGITGDAGAALAATNELDQYYADLQQQAIYDAIAKAADLESTNRAQDMGYATDLANLSLQDQYQAQTNAYNQALLDMQRKAYSDEKKASTWEGIGALGQLFGIGQGGLSKLITGGVDLYKTLFPGKTTAPATTVTPQKLANPLGNNAAILSPGASKLLTSNSYTPVVKPVLTVPKTTTTLTKPQTITTKKATTTLKGRI